LYKISSVPAVEAVDIEPLSCCSSLNVLQFRYGVSELLHRSSSKLVQLV
jgi:hypothetical protein